MRRAEEVLLGPCTVSAQSDYDFSNPSSLEDISFIDPKTGKEEMILHYSLGQLDSEEGAKAEALSPIFEELAQKIVALLIRSPL